jgi:hypothetical protein
MKPKNKKLWLKKETINNLSNFEVELIFGGKSALGGGCGSQPPQCDTKFDSCKPCIPSPTNEPCK